MKQKPKKQPGPEAERVKIDAPWEDAVKLALEKPRPKDGWPSASESKSKSTKQRAAQPLGCVQQPVPPKRNP